MDVISVVGQEDGSAIMQLDNITDHEFYQFVRQGHRLNKGNFNEHECFELGVIHAIRVGMELDKAISNRSAEQTEQSTED